MKKNMFIIIFILFTVSIVFAGGRQEEGHCSIVRSDQEISNEKLQSNVSEFRIVMDLMGNKVKLPSGFLTGYSSNSEEILTILVGLMFFPLFMGRHSVSPGRVLSILVNKIMGTALGNTETLVVWDIRLPRVLLCVMVGAMTHLHGNFYGRDGVCENN